MIKVFLCVKDFSVIKEMMDYENESGNIKIVGISTTVVEDLEELNLEVDILVLQFAIDPPKACRLLEYLLLHNLYALRILPLFQELDSEIIHLLLQYEIKNFLIQPFEVSQLISAIEQEQIDQELSISSTNVEAKASEIMNRLGLPAHLDGFSYIRSAAVYIAKYFPSVHLNMGQVYQETARAHHSTAVRVEKCIRTAIANAYRNQPEKICVYNCRPTNRQIILYISEKLKLTL